MPDLTLKQLTEVILAQAKRKGFGTQPEEINPLEKFALIHSEISEAVDAYRYKKIMGADGMAEELADAVIRILHLAGVFGIDIEQEMLSKIKSNEDRQWEWDKMNEAHLN